MLGKRWLALAALALCGSAGSLYGQGALSPHEAPAAPAPQARAKLLPGSQQTSVKQTVVRQTAVKQAAKVKQTSTARYTTEDGPPVLTTGPTVPLGEHGHGNCNTDCASAGDGSSGGIMGGVALYFLRPSISNNTAFITTGGIGSPRPIVASQDFDWDYHIAPAAWLGWSGPAGVGVRARYFHFDHDSEATRAALTAGGAVSGTITAPAGLSPLLGVPPRGFQAPGILLQDAQGLDLLSFHSDLHIQNLDGEATYSLTRGNLSMLVAAGGRYTQMHQNYRGLLVNTVSDTTGEVSNLHAGHNFYGAGPTVAWQGTWRIGGTSLGIFGSARGALLVGTTRQTAAFSENITDPVNGNQSNLALNLARDQATLPIVELEGGLEWGRSLGRTYVFVRGAAVNHTYFDAGSASTTDGNLSLFGVQMSVGVGF
jgi:hypothetical protein